MTWAAHKIQCRIFFCSAHVIIEFLLPKLTEVLSTETPTQLLHKILFSWKTQSIFSKMDAAVADWVTIWQQKCTNDICTPYIIINMQPHVKVWCTNLLWGTCPESVWQCILHWHLLVHCESVHFSSPVSLDPSTAMENGWVCIVLMRVSLKWGARHLLSKHMVFVLADA